MWEKIRAAILRVFLPHALIASIMPAPTWGATWDELNAAARDVERQFQIEMRISNAALRYSQSISYQSISRGEYSNAAAHLQLLNEELGKYPRTFLREVGLKWIGLVKNLAVSGEPRSATYDYLEQALLFDVRQGSYDKPYQRHSVHHEFFHLIDYVVTGFSTNQPWLALNPKGFRYWQNRGMRDPGTAMLDHPQAGFVTTYAMSSVLEDRAETHAALFVGEHYRELMRIMQEDPVVRRKVSYIIQMLNRIDPAINEAYFRRLHEIKAPARSR